MVELVDTRDLKSLGNSRPGSSPGFGILCVKSHAKINLYLNILGKRPDGYHEIQTIYQGISLHDTLWISPSAQYELALHSDSHPDFGSQVPLGSRNLITRAYNILQKRKSIPPVRVVLKKKIPPQGGLGGASSNAAALLKGMSEICGGIDKEILEEVAAEVGSDVQFFLGKGIYSATGRGEKLEYLGEGPRWKGVLIYPGEGISTEYAYAHWGKAQKVSTFALMQKFLKREEKESMCLKSFCGLVYNTFQESVGTNRFVIQRLFEHVESVGTGIALLCGSGSCVMVFCETSSLIEAVISGIKTFGCESWEVSPEEETVKIKYN